MAKKKWLKCATHLVLLDADGSCVLCKKSFKKDFEPIDLDGERDYVLTGDKAWITVGNLSVAVKRTDEGVMVDIYPLGLEDEDEPIASTYAFDNEGLPNEEKDPIILINRYPHDHVGYNSRGWWFFDEGEQSNGPFPTEQAARAEMWDYATTFLAMDVPWWP